MLTFMKNPQLPPFCSITGTTAPIVIPSYGSLIIDRAIRIFAEKHPVVFTIDRVIMPDHLHWLIYVRHPLDKPFGNLISDFKGTCSRLLWEGNTAYADDRVPFFSKQYNDRIVTKKDQLPTLKRYILDNPRRYLMKRLHPDLFVRVNGITINGENLTAFGNPFLLREAVKEAVIVRSHFTPEELNRLREHWRQLSLEGGVLVSPFISPKERGIRDEVLDSGGKIIEIRDNGFPERFKPSGKAFEHCLNGQLLYIAPEKYDSQKSFLTREKAWKMNNLAVTVCNLDFSNQLSLKRLHPSPFNGF